MMSVRVERSIRCDRGKKKKNCAHLSASQDDLSRHEDEEHNFRFDHTVNQTREQLGQTNVKMLNTERSGVHKPLAHNC